MTNQPTPVIPSELVDYLDAVTRGFITAHLWTDAEPLDYDPEAGGSGGLQWAQAGPALTVWGREVSARFLAAADPADVLAFIDGVEVNLRAAGRSCDGPPGEYVGHTLYLEAARSGVSFTDRAWRDDDPLTPDCGRLSAVAQTFTDVEFAEAAREREDGTVDL